MYKYSIPFRKKFFHSRTSLLAKPNLKKFGKLATAFISLLQLVQSQDDIRTVIRTIRNKFKYNISIASNDKLFVPFYKWFLAEAVKQEVSRKDIDLVMHELDSPFTSNKRFFELIEYVSTNVPLTIKIGSSKVQLVIDERTSAPNAQYAEPHKRLVRVSTFSKETFKKIKEVIEGLAEEISAEEKHSFVYAPSRWDGWDKLRLNSSRALDCVVLPVGVKELLVEDVTQFISSEEIYKAFNIPYHRGYLFYGPPGTGKTSTITALAAFFQMNVYTLDLTAIRSANDLNNKIASIDPYSVLILEDIDVISAAVSREQAKSDMLSLNTLLQILDGVHTPHGLIVFMTTNDLSKLDEALIRKGRIDLQLHLDYLDDDQLHRLTKVYFPEENFTLPSLAEKKLAPAEVCEIFKSNFGNPSQFYAQLIDLIHVHS